MAKNDSSFSLNELGVRQDGLLNHQLDGLGVHFVPVRKLKGVFGLLYPFVGHQFNCPTAQLNQSPVPIETGWNGLMSSLKMTYR